MAKNYLIEILIDSLRCKKSKMFQTAL